MSVMIEAPYPRIQHVLQMPNPIFSDSKAIAAQMDFAKSINNTPHTYIVTNEDWLLNYSFDRVGRGKLLELIDLIENYADGKMRLTTHEDEIWKVTLETIPAQFIMDVRSFPCGGGAAGRDESGRFELQFIGKQIG